MKNFAINGKIKYLKYLNSKIGFFNIFDSNKNQLIAIKGFYSMDIEKGMNDLENKGVSVVKKIAQKAQFSQKISLTRGGILALKFYSLLSGSRTHKLRNDISNTTGDSLFNKMISDTNVGPKLIQERMIKLTLDYWKMNKNRIKRDFLTDIENSESDKIKESTLINILNTIQSRLIIFKFESNNLLLTEAFNFTLTQF